MNAVNAWLLDLGDGLHAAVGEQEMIHLLPESQPGWRPLALACFEHANIGPVPELDLHRVFSPPSGANG